MSDLDELTDEEIRERYPNLYKDAKALIRNAANQNDMRLTGLIGLEPATVYSDTEPADAVRSVLKKKRIRGS